MFLAAVGAVSGCGGGSIEGPEPDASSTTDGEAIDRGSFEAPDVLVAVLQLRDPYVFQDAAGAFGIAVAEVAYQLPTLRSRQRRAGVCDGSGGRQTSPHGQLSPPRSGGRGAGPQAVYRWRRRPLTPATGVAGEA